MMIVRTRILVLLATICSLVFLASCDYSLMESEDEETSENTATFYGLVVEGGDSNSTGEPIAYVEVETNPVISNITMTDEYGEFESKVLRNNTNYRFTASKYGYMSETHDAVAGSSEIPVQLTLERDVTRYVFITITVSDTSDYLLPDSRIGTAGAAKTEIFLTNISGQVSYPFPRSEETAITISQTGYYPVTGTYNDITGEFNKMSGTGTVVVSGSNIFVYLEPM
ncbi:MAG: hypothetical protein ACOCWZ_09000 [Spirochaetota bacterium]